MKQSRTNIWTGISLWLTAVVVLVGVYVLSPAYIVPFYNHPVGRLAVIAIFCLHTVTCVLYTIVNVLKLPGLLRVGPMLLCILTTFAVILTPTLGPAAITIAEATGHLPVAAPK